MTETQDSKLKTQNSNTAKTQRQPKTQTLVVAVIALMAAGPAHAQSSDRPAPAAEFLVGHAGFLDDTTSAHSVFGASARAYLTRRLAVGPELVYMRGPGSDRDTFLTGNLTFDLMKPRGGRPPRVSPFVVVGGGLFTHSDRFATATYASSEGAFTAGGGTRVWITDRIYGLVELRVGWEPHYRVTGGIGIALGSG
jgi:hypothetical protein